MEKDKSLRTFSSGVKRTDLVRTETLNGRQHIVAPVIGIVEGVHNGEFIAFEEIAVFPDAWNGRPLPIDHPMDADGNPVTAGSPSVMEKSVVGFLFNVVAREDLRGISGEIWVDTEKAMTVPGGEEVLKRLQGDGDSQLEVSTAYYTFVENTPGEWKGPNGIEKYKNVQTQIRPDHLALLPFDIGACNWKDGCGAPRINATVDQPVELKDAGGDVPKKEDLKVNGKQLGKALSGAIAAHVGEDGTTTGIENRLAVAAGISVEKLTSLIAGELDFAPRHWLTVFAAVLDIDPWDIYMAASNDNSDVRYNSEKTAEKKMTVKNSTDDTKDAMTISHNENDCGPCQKSLKGKVLEILKSLGLKGAELKEDKEEMEANEKKAKIDALIASDKTQFSENHREWLTALTDDQIAVLEPKEPKTVEVQVEKPAVKAAAQNGDCGCPDKEKAAQVEKPVPVQAALTKSQILEILGVSDEELVANKSAIAEKKAARNAKITEIAAIEGCPYSKAELETLSDEMLDKTLDILQPNTLFRTAPAARRQAEKIPAAPSILLAKPGVKGVDFATPARQPGERS